MINRCQLVRKTCAWVTAHAEHITIHPEKIPALAKRFAFKPFKVDSHLTDHEIERNLLELFLLNSMNFCFWPVDNFQFEQLMQQIKQLVDQGIKLQDLSIFTEEDVVVQLFQRRFTSLAEERAGIIRQLALGVLQNFEGSLTKLVKSANKSAVNLLNILCETFPNFQDHSIYKGHQIHFYKRGQILISFIYQQFRGYSIGQFWDIEELTVFPDYRIPQLLEAHSILSYSPQLKQAVNNKQVITDRNWECEIRAFCQVASEMIRVEIEKQEGRKVLSIEVDAFLWQLGESSLATLPPHHRCLTIYY